MPSNPWDDLIATANADTGWYTRIPSTYSGVQFRDNRRSPEDIEIMDNYLRLKSQWNLMSRVERQSSDIKQRLEELTSDVINIGGVL